MYTEVGAMVPKPNSAQGRTVVSTNTCSPTKLMQPNVEPELFSYKSGARDPLAVLRADHEMLLTLDREAGEAIGRYFGDCDHEFLSAHQPVKVESFSEVFHHALSPSSRATCPQIGENGEPSRHVIENSNGEAACNMPLVTARHEPVADPGS